MIVSVEIRNSRKRFSQECSICGARPVTKTAYFERAKINVPLEYCEHCDAEPPSIIQDNEKQWEWY